MLGKRPHQIHRTTSMSQIRPPPPIRPRVSLDFGTSKKDSASHQFSDQRFHEDFHQHHHHPHHYHDSAHLDVNNGIIMMPKFDALPASAAGIHTHHGFVKPSPVAMVTVMKKHGTVQSFMDACYSCKRPLGHGRDIFMYRGDAAFCTEECRMKQMSRDEQRQQRSMQKGSSNGSSKLARKAAPASAS